MRVFCTGCNVDCSGAYATHYGEPYHIECVPHRQQAPRGECKYCDDMRATGTKFFPSHDASPNCKSGKRPHCTCDTCF